MTHDLSILVIVVVSLIGISSAATGHLRLKKMLYWCYSLVSLVIVVLMVILLFTLMKKDTFIVSIAILCVYSFGSVISIWFLHRDMNRIKSFNNYK